MITQVACTGLMTLADTGTSAAAPSSRGRSETLGRKDMTLPFTIRTKNAEYEAELDESLDAGNAVWFSLPFRASINMLGSAIYFEMPLDPLIEGEMITVFDKGDICWWPRVSALVILFGPMPLSGEDGRPVTKHKMVKIGRVLGDCSSMEDAGDRQRIDLVKNDF